MPRRLVRTLPTLLTVAAVASGLALVAPTVAQAASAPKGAIISASQDAYSNLVTVRGWAYDAAHSSAPVTVVVYADGKLLGRARTTYPTTALNRSRKIKGTHGFILRVTRAAAVRSVETRTEGAHATRGHRTTLLATSRVTRTTPATATRILAVAKRYVGKARYAEGGATPRRGFDCSGYTQYVYAAAKAGRLPHNAAGQKSMKRMRAVSAKAARPGDLVFYHGGGGIFHVAIYAGHHKQYAAATPRDGIVYQEIWSSSVSYGHLV